MAEHVISGSSSVAPGTYECATCGYRLVYDATERLQPCPSCAHGDWDLVTTDAPSSERDRATE
jgi:rubrerythrin